MSKSFQVNSIPKHCGQPHVLWTLLPLNLWCCYKKRL